MQERRPGPGSEEAGTGSPLSWQRRGGSNVALCDFSRGFLRDLAAARCRAVIFSLEKIAIHE